MSRLGHRGREGSPSARLHDLSYFSKFMLTCLLFSISLSHIHTHSLSLSLTHTHTQTHTRTHTHTHTHTHTQTTHTHTLCVRPYKNPCLRKAAWVSWKSHENPFWQFLNQLLEPSLLDRQTDMNPTDLIPDPIWQHSESFSRKKWRPGTLAVQPSRIPNP